MTHTCLLKRIFDANIRLRKPLSQIKLDYYRRYSQLSLYHCTQEASTDLHIKHQHREISKTEISCKSSAWSRRNANQYHSTVEHFFLKCLKTTTTHFNTKKNNQQKQQHKNCASLHSFIWQTINIHTGMLNCMLQAAEPTGQIGPMTAELPDTFSSDVRCFRTTL